jgi:phi13 family phage major tail protein
MKIGVKNSSSMDAIYADDQTVDMIYDDGDVEIEIEITDLTEDEKALIFGQTMSAGVRTPNPTTDQRPYFAVSWKSKKRDLTYKYYKILKVMFKEPDEDFETRKEKTAAQTDKITGTGIQRISDKLRKRIADASSTTWVAGTGTGWFTTGDISPDTTPPTISSVVPADAATGVATSAVIVWTFSEAILASTATSANFLLCTAAGVAKAGTVTINPANTIVTFTPTTALAGSSTVYIATVTTNVKDASGNALAANSVTKFTTA